MEISRSSEVRNKPKWLVFHSVKLTTKNFIQTVSAIEPEWLLDIAPKYYDMSNFPEGTARDELLRIIRRRELGEQEAHRSGFLNPKRRRM